MSGAASRFRAGDARLWLAVVFVALALVPPLARLGPENYILSLVTRAMIFAIAAMALDLVVGYGGLVSFGHAAFVGIGAYAAGMLAAHDVGSFAVHVTAAVAAAAVFAAATGAVALRASGVYYIMSTLAFGQMAFFLAVSLSAYGGDDGMTLARRGTLFGQPWLASNAAFYYAVLAILGGVWWALRRVVASRFGRVLAGVRDNRERMAAIGFAPFPFQLAASVIAGAIAAIAGVLLANESQFVSPAFMSWQRSGDLLIMVILGGIGTLHGALIGAFALVLLEEWLSTLTEHWKLIFGPFLVLVVLIGRGGIVGALGRLGAARHG